MPKISDTVLYVIHNRSWAQSRVADAMRARGYDVNFLCPCAGDPLPGDLSGLAGVVVGGGSHSVNDAPHRTYLADEIAWARRVAEAGVPYFGICLGAQILGAAFGGRVAPRGDGVVEYGFYPIRPTEAGRALFGGLSHVFQSHHESLVALPPDAEILARGDTFETQAFRVGPHAVGVQFHPDARLDMMAAWCDECARHLDRPGAQSKAEQLRLAPRHEAAMQRWVEGFVVGWLSPARHRLSA